jgi:hypothetical protein
MRFLLVDGARLAWPVMHPASGVCPERERLLRKLNGILDSHNDSVQAMVALAGTGHTALFEAAKKRAAETRHQVRTAREEFEAHIREHACGLEQN